MRDTSTETSRLETLDAGLRVLEMLMHRDRLGIGDVVRELGMSRSAAHRSLRTLAARSFISLSASGRGYFAGPRLLELTGVVPTDPSTRLRHRRVVQEARDLTGESVHSAVLVGSRVMVVDGRRSQHALDIGLRIGMTAPAHAMAAGKLLLAACNDEQVTAIVPPDPMPAQASATIRTVAELLGVLDATRRAGWAKAVEESEPGIASVAVPLDGDHWRDRVALVVSLPTERSSPVRLRELARAARGVVEIHRRQGAVQPWRFAKSGRAVGVSPGAADATSTPRGPSERTDIVCGTAFRQHRMTNDR